MKKEFIYKPIYSKCFPSDNKVKIRKVKTKHIISKEQKLKYKANVENRYKVAKSGAERRNKEFKLTIEDYKNLISPICHYCHGFFGEIISGCGLDRIDNNIGYTVDNCVPCCAYCNIVKGSFLTQEEAEVAIEAIIKLKISMYDGS